MQITIDLNSIRPEFVVSHADQTLRFSAVVFQKKTFEQPFDVLEPTNTFISTLTASEQERLYDVYRRVSLAFDQLLDASELQEFLINAMREIFSMIPINRIHSWITMDSGFLIPPELQDVFVQDEEMKNSRDKTYLKHDYVELCAFTVFLRLYMPLFGEYLGSLKRSTGVDRKEDEVLTLLYGTEIPYTPAAEKLKIYIREITSKKTINSEQIVAGSSSLDAEEHLLSLVILRKLCTADVRGVLAEKGGLIARVYSFIYQKTNSQTKSETPVREKIFSSDDSESNSKRSILESYRKRTELSLADIAGFETAYKKYAYTARRLCPEITEQEVMASVNTALQNKDKRLGDAQILIMSWVFKRIHAPKAIYYIPSELIWANLGVLEAVLWRWGFKYLSVFVSSYGLQDQDTMHITPIDSRSQLSDEIVKTIKEQYPYTWTTTKKTNGQLIEEPHPVLYSIDLAVDSILKGAWRATCSDERLAEFYGNQDPRRRLSVPPNIKQHLAELIVFVNRLPKPTHPLLN